MQAKVLTDMTGRCSNYIDSKGIQSDCYWCNVEPMHVVSCCSEFKSSCVESQQAVCICVMNSLL